MKKTTCFFSLLLVFVFCCAGVFTPVHAASEIKEAAEAADPLAEKRLQALSVELRCLVCQNQTIADSDAELAQDLRREIRHLIATGKSDADIIDFMVTRYGDFVLYRPPVKALTLLLWGGPFLFFFLAIFFLYRYLKLRERKVASEAPLSASDIAKVNAMLKKGDTL